MSELADKRFAIVSAALVMDTESIHDCIEAIINDGREPERYVEDYRTALAQFDAFTRAIESYREASNAARARLEANTRERDMR